MEKKLFSKRLIRPHSHALVVGLGRSGLSAVNFLKSISVRVSVSDAFPMDRIDGQIVEELTQKVEKFETGGHSKELFTSVDFIVVSPGVPLDIPALNSAYERGIPVVGELGLAACCLKTPLVAVTGTNGKSTVTTLLGELFRASGKKVFVGGNIGRPLTDYLVGPQDADVVVAEVSSFQLDTAGEFRPDVAVLLNISPDHLDRYDSYEAYVASKFRIFAFQRPGDIAVLNADDPEIIRHERKNGFSDDIRWPESNVLFFGNRLQGRNGASLKGRKVVLSGSAALSGNEEIYDLDGTSLAAQPNLQNAMAAIIAARHMGCSDSGIRKGITGFVPLPHRLAMVAEIGGVRYYDDSKATNVGAVHSALTCMNSPVILIAGGRDKGGEYVILNELIREKVKAMVLIGEAGFSMAEAFGSLTSVQLADTLPDAVRRASNMAGSGDAVLLSPACASFDMFNDYAQRGRVFRDAVNSLEGSLKC
ncbi:MAG: UDP-N-acetylmuramoyl-L-alanine--D-glutamate ligase [Desulfobulbaceae bacterium]|nr:UDP-N-acetylmuramoyl-L-alanine--D-glutamate ligase [Desulfobulbaceae bacterium]MCK5436518.1 UDP-N-acetylmuramoyl-L-alanine--D-glutamate ligase [Desulfobulbaceae bacterium]